MTENTTPEAARVIHSEELAEALRQLGEAAETILGRAEKRVDDSFDNSVEVLAEYLTAWQNDDPIRGTLALTKADPGGVLFIAALVMNVWAHTMMEQEGATPEQAKRAVNLGEMVRVTVKALEHQEGEHECPGCAAEAAAAAAAEGPTVSRHATPARGQGGRHRAARPRHLRIPMNVRKFALAVAALAVVGFTSACVPDSGEPLAAPVSGTASLPTYGAFTPEPTTPKKARDPLTADGDFRVGTAPGQIPPGEYNVEVTGNYGGYYEVCSDLLCKISGGMIENEALSTGETGLLVIPSNAVLIKDKRDVTFIPVEG